MKRNTTDLAIRMALAACLVLASGAIGTAGAGTRPVDERADADATGTVFIENIAGAIEIEGWNKEEVHVTGTLGDDVEELKFKAGGKKTHIEVKYPRHSKNIKEGARLVIKVPRGSRIEVECISASVTVKGVQGEIYAASISGDVEVSGGDAGLTAETISGDVRVDSPAPKVSIESISGTVRAKGAVAEVSASVVSGKIDLEFERFLDLEVEAVSGTVTAAGDLDKGAKVEIDVHSGNITLVVPGSVSADFRIDTFSGGIDNDFGQKARKTSKYTPGKELEFVTGEGDARVRINTFSGDVVIRKR